MGGHFASSPDWACTQRHLGIKASNTTSAYFQRKARSDFPSHRQPFFCRARLALRGLVTTGIKRWGNIIVDKSSTIFGSTIINLTFVGRALHQILEIMPLTATDLPDPVRPRYQRIGASGKSRFELNHLAFQRNLKEFSRICFRLLPNSRKETDLSLSWALIPENFPGIGINPHPLLLGGPNHLLDWRCDWPAPTTGLTSYLVTEGPIFRPLLSPWYWSF